MILLVCLLAPFVAAWAILSVQPIAERVRGREDITVPVGLGACLALAGMLMGLWALPLWTCLALAPLTGLSMVIDADPWAE